VELVALGRIVSLSEEAYRQWCVCVVVLGVGCSKFQEDDGEKEEERVREEEGGRA
jgi:hypothetical protein